MRTRLIAALLATAASLLPALPLAAQGLKLAEPAAQAPADSVMARVDGEEIRRSEVMSTLAGMADELQGMAPPEMLKAATDRAIEKRLLDKAAQKSNVAATPEYKAQLADLEHRLARQMFLQRWIAERTTEPELRRAYAEAYPGGKGEKQVHARHILVKTKAEADKVIADLAKGAKFETLAAERTIDPSGKTTGGDLGFFGQGQMVPAFEKAAFALKPGETSKAPVESQFGWHVIRVEAEKTEPAPSFEQAAPELRQRVGHKLLAQLFGDLKKDAKVEYVGPAADRNEKN